MTDLIPHHTPRTLPADSDGWVVTEYRGASVDSLKHNNILRMSGHPFDGKIFGQLTHVLMLVDRWLDHGDLPRPYVWPVPQRPVRAR